MSKSKEFVELYSRINLKNIEKQDGYSIESLESIPDVEREEIEEIIVDAFKSGDSLLSKLVIHLKYFSGEEILKDELNKSNIPSGRCIEVSSVLYQHTSDIKYLDLIIKNYDLSDNIAKTTILSKMLNFERSEILFDVFAKCCMEGKEKVIRTTAANGMLYCKGYIRNPFDMMELIRNAQYNQALTSDSESERKNNINRLKRGSL